MTTPSSRLAAAPDNCNHKGIEQMKSSSLIWIGGGDRRKVVKIADPE
jgi:hypothetical protein